MQAVQCAVVAPDDESAVAQEIVETISRSGVAAAFRCTALPAGLDGVEAVLIVTRAAALSTAVRQLAELRRRAPRAVALVAVDGAGPESLESLLSAGTFDFLIIPVQAGELIARLRRALGVVPPPPPPMPPADARQIRGLVYASAALSDTAVRLNTVSRCDANVLILGETGTGKEVCAQAVHYLSARAPNPWVAVNCGAIPGDLVENELFGHVKGAYTTALAARSGLVREAERGTLFLDDVDCLPLAAQAKLLRFLQEREYRPVGSNQVLHADVRVIAASNCDLLALAQRGAFRMDLYFRLNVLRVSLPALRERRDDIPVLALHFMRQFAREFHSAVTGLAPAALRRLCAHDWPGNVRELKHVIERAVLMAGGPVLVEGDVEIDGVPMAPAPDTDESFRSAKRRAVTSFERAYLERMLVAHNGNVTHAADASKKDRRAFFELMRKHDIQPQRFRSEAPR